MSDAIDAKIESLGDWRGARLTRIRQLIKSAVPEVIEEVKWRKATNPLGVPTWSHAGLICTGESDPDGLFNASLTGVRRAIDIGEADEINEAALADLVRQAAAINAAGARS
jgi:hypothetical protein